MDPSATPHVELELKLTVPSTARKAFLRAFTATRIPPRSIRLQARYFDTPERDLARAGMALRLRREGRRWIQTLKTTVPGELGRSEYSIARTEASVDLAALAGTPAAAILGLSGQEPNAQWASVLELRYETSIRRLYRRQRVRGGVVELAFDEGRLIAGAGSLPVCELEIELVSGAPHAVFDVARRWQARFGLHLDPRSKAERGDALARGETVPGPTKAASCALPKGIGSAQAFDACVRSCIEQVQGNAAAIASGAGGDEHVHQLRVGIRRLRTAWRFFEGWVPPVSGELVDGARELFASLGADRDLTVIATEIEPRILAAGMPAALVGQTHAAGSPTAAEVVAGARAQRWLLALLESVECAVRPAEQPSLGPLAFRRLQRWHDRVVAQGSLAQMQESARHTLRKRAKRLRYATEFCAALCDRKRLARYLKRLAALQQAFGDLIDLYMARDRYAALPESLEAGWFARGWIAGRLAAAEAACELALQGLRETRTPWK